MFIMKKLNTKRYLIQFYMISVRNVSDKITNHIDNKLKKDLLQQYLGLSYGSSAAFIRNNQYIKDIEWFKLNETLNSLQKMGLKPEDIKKNPMTLTLHYNTVEHNVMYLKEAGFTDISAQFLLRFRNVVKKPVGLLKAHGMISEQINVPERLYSFLHPKPSQFPCFDEFTEEDSIVRMHELIFKNYLVWRLDTNIEEINRIFKTYDKFKYRSFQLISNMIELLTKELKFSRQKLLQQSYLFQVNPQYPERILNVYPTIAGVNIKDILYKYPKIITSSPESIASTYKHLKTFGINDEAISNCFDIFTLCSETVLHRLNAMVKVPEFNALIRSKRFVQLLFHYNKAKLRLDHLKKNQVRNTSINLLCVTDNRFKKFTLEGYDTNRGADIVNYLSDIFQVSVIKIRKLFGKNPHWCQVPLTNIQDSLRFLKRMRFPIEEISRFPVILLYSRNIIETALKELETHPELSNLKLLEREKLNLCLYLIERKYHFSGDGVWESKMLDKIAGNDTSVSTKNKTQLSIC